MRDPMLSTINYRDVKDSIVTPKPYDPDHDRINRELDLKFGFGDKVSRNNEVPVSNYSHQIISERPNIKVESNYGIPSSNQSHA
jgi:hypothetical protein